MGNFFKLFSSTSPCWGSSWIDSSCLGCSFSTNEILQGAGPNVFKEQSRGLKSFWWHLRHTRRQWSYRGRESWCLGSTWCSSWSMGAAVLSTQLPVFPLSLETTWFLKSISERVVTLLFSVWTTTVKELNKVTAWLCSGSTWQCGLPLQSHKSSELQW